MESRNRGKMILIIKTNKESLHELEFVKPIEDILSKSKIEFKSIHYDNLTKKDLENSDKIVISGTSLKDNQFLEDLNKFEWIKEFQKPILGICSGMQIIGLTFGSKIKKQTEIGQQKISFKKEFLGLNSEVNVYMLHNNSINLPKDFVEFTDSKFPKAIKHKSKEIYGVLFHPEVFNKEMILEF